MSTSAHLTVRRGLLCAAAAAAALATAAPATAGSYGWPLKPFDRQHPVRAFFGDPRIAGHDAEHGTLHFGIDISARDGTPVYATLTGTASIHPLHPDTVIVGAGSVGHEYWHVVPAVQPGQRIVAFRTIIGRVERPWGHVHFSETRGGVYVNPLRPGALAPYRDTTPPRIHTFGFERNGAPVGRTVRGAVDLVVEAWDDVPVAVPTPWNDKPVAPALVEWRLEGPRVLAGTRRWRVAADFRAALPRVPFASVYAMWTRQNHGWKRGGRGRYRYVLAGALDTRSLLDGTYRLEARVADTRGNSTVGSATFRVRNQAA
jgi:hypothetical protein